MGTPNNDRGIQNAQARYAKRIEGLLVSSQTPRKQKRARFATNDPRYDDDTGFSQNNPQELIQSFNRIRETFKKSGEKLNDTDIRELSSMKQDQIPKAHFPYFIFTIALIKDIIDAIATVTLIGIVVSMALSFVCAVILFIWTLMKLGNTGVAQKRMTNKILMRCGLAIGIELIPGLNVIPTATIFVLFTYFEEKKVGKLFKLAHAQLHSGRR